MDSEAWVAKLDVCRCCLSARGTWDLTTRIEGGITEPLLDQLNACYGITLSYLSEPDASHAICGACVNLLRCADSFRRQVLIAEENFVKFFKIRQGAEKDIKLENYSGIEYCDYEYIDLGRGCDAEETKTDIKLEMGTEPMQEDTLITTDYDSDAPVAKLSKCKDSDVVNEPAVDNNSTKGPQHTKTLSERKSVILNCSVVLKDTNACPFRHHKSWFQCFYCTMEFMKMSSLRTHTVDIHKDVETELRKMKRYPRSLQIDISNLECRQCHLNLTDVDSMQRHFESVHEKMIYKMFIADYKVDTSPYSCHLCKEVFHVFRTLTTHLNEHYANCICDVCGRSFMNSKRLKVHKRTHEKGQFPCIECGKILKTKTSKANHMESAHSKRQLKCQICLEPMKHYNDRIKHMSVVHNITHVFKCNICFKEYNIKHYLATHMRQTHGNKNKKCPECGMVFITNHGLKKHMSKHSGIKPHKCLVCGKAYARSYTLKEHMRGHDGDRMCEND